MLSADAFDRARARYLSEVPNFKSAEERMRVELGAVQRLAGVRAEVEVRAKTVSSFIKKLHVKRKQYADPWHDVTDKLGARMIVETLRDLGRVRSVLENPTLTPVEVLRVEDKTAEADEYLLYYPGIHVQVVVPDVVTSFGEPIECEIQLRTKAQDLWSVPSHKLVYKPTIEASRDVRRRVLRLSVLVEIFDDEIEEAMKVVEATPGYEEARLLEAAESLYLSFVADPGERELSLMVIEALSPALGSVDRYDELLVGFVNEQREKLGALFDKYGVYSAWANEEAYWMASQPESLIVLERVEHEPMRLAETVRDTDMHVSVARLFELWGREFPD